MQHCNSIRTIAILVLASLCTSPGAEGTHARQQLNVDTFSQLTSPHDVFDIFFLDEIHGWMAITDRNSSIGYILRTEDGGNSWRRLKAPSGITRLFFTNQDHGWALRFSSLDSNTAKRSIDLFATEDGGMHWKKLSLASIVRSTEQITSLAFYDELHGWLVGNGPGRTGLIIQTDDGGNTLKRSDHLPKDISNCLGVYAGPKTGALIFGFGFVVRSVDNGKTWQSPIKAEELGVDKTVFDMSSAKFTQDGRGWLVGQAGGGTILASLDFGQTWRIEFEDKEGTIFQDLWLLDNQRRCAVGNRTFLFCTANDGLTWTSRDVLPPPTTGQSRLFRQIVLLDSGRGWVLRYGGYLYGTTDGGQTWHEFDPLSQ
jgi:photosystem II stability/assembly factor-like uncharacterized protein